MSTTAISARLAKLSGISPRVMRDGILGFKAKKWGNGIMGDKNARWRKGLGLSHGMRSKKFIIAKTAKAS